MTTWYITRHAEKEQGDFYNPSLHHQDEPISPRGLEEARKLSIFFSDKQISAIYISAYQRTRQTITDTAKLLNLEPILDSRLNEIDNGQIEGLADEEIQRLYPRVWKAYNERNADFHFPDGESGEEARSRIKDFMEEKLNENGDKNIILVSHEGLIRLLTCHIMDLPVYKRWNFHVDTCGIMEIKYQHDFKAWKLIRFNQALP